MVDKMSLSFPADVGDDIRRAATRAGTSVSAWMAEAARSRLRSEALRILLDEYQSEHGAFTTEELAAAERALGLHTAADAAA